MTGLLRYAIQTLRLRPDAPWPSQIRRRQGYVMRALRKVSRHSKRHN